TMAARKSSAASDTCSLMSWAWSSPARCTANIQDEDGCKAVLDQVQSRFSRLKKIWADSRYASKRTPECVWTIYELVWEVVRRLEEAVGFAVLPRRWVVERTSDWFVLYRRLSKDHERDPLASETMGICGDDPSDAPAATTRVSYKNTY